MLFRQSLALKISTVVDVLVTLGLICVFMTLIDSKSSYIGIGPSEDFYVVTMQVNTWPRYIGLLIMIAIIKVSITFSSDFSYPIVHFNVYDPNKKNVENFNRFELWALTNFLFTSGSIRNVFMTVITVSRIDVAFFGVF